MECFDIIQWLHFWRILVTWANAHEILREKEQDIKSHTQDSNCVYTQKISQRKYTTKKGSQLVLVTDDRWFHYLEYKVGLPFICV